MSGKEFHLALNSIEPFFRGHWTNCTAACWLMPSVLEVDSCSKDQKTNRSANWICLESILVPVITP
jgi:hypothetical protein